MENKSRHSEDTSSEDESNESNELILSGCARRRFPSQMRRRRRRLILIRRLGHRRSLSTSSEGTPSEDSYPRLRFRRHRPCPCSLPIRNESWKVMPIEPAREIQQQVNNNNNNNNNNKRWYNFVPWRDILFVIASVVMLVLFLETHIETFITGQPAQHYSCYLFSVIVCSVLWSLVAMQDEFDEDLRDGN